MIGRLLQSPLVRASKPFGTCSKGLSFVLRKASEQSPSTAPSDKV